MIWFFGDLSIPCPRSGLVNIIKSVANFVPVSAEAPLFPSGKLYSLCTCLYVHFRLRYSVFSYTLRWRDSQHTPCIFRFEYRILWYLRVAVIWSLVKFILLTISYSILILQSAISLILRTALLSSRMRSA